MLRRDFISFLAGAEMGQFQKSNVYSGKPASLRAAAIGADTLGAPVAT